ncbi:MAG: hypothetical protein ACFB4I_21625 [Cyanophyceae cyanobacterium]
MARSLEQLETHSFEQVWQSLAHNRWLPFALLAIATASNVVYAHPPLVAFATMSGVMLTRQRAVTVALLSWLINQGIGFGLRGYPLTGVAFAWGILMGLGTLLVVALASWRPFFSQSTWTGHFLWLAIAVLSGFVLYQGSILLAFPVLSDGHYLDWDIVAKLFLKQLVWAGAIALGHSLLLWRIFISSSSVES